MMKNLFSFDESLGFFMKIWKYEMVYLQVTKLCKICVPPLTVEFGGIEYITSQPTVPKLEK